MFCGDPLSFQGEGPMRTTLAGQLTLFNHFCQIVHKACAIWKSEQTAILLHDQVLEYLHHVWILLRQYMIASMSKPRFTLSHTFLLKFCLTLKWIMNVKRHPNSAGVSMCVFGGKFLFRLERKTFQCLHVATLKVKLLLFITSALYS